MRRKKTSSSSQETVAARLLPDDCWESIFRIIINDYNEDFNISRYLNPLSLVSKQFLYVTNRLRSSLTLTFYQPSLFHSIFKRFTDLNSLKFPMFCYNIDVHKILLELSCFPLKHLTSLNISYQHTIPAIGLRAFSQKITTLTSLICNNIRGKFSNTDLFLIAECFPLLEELDLSYPSRCEDHASYVDGFEALSLALIKLRKINISGFPVNNQSLFHLFNNCKNLEEVVMFDCGEISNSGIASSLRERTTLRCLSFSTTIKNPDHIQLLATSHFIDSLMRYKDLSCLALKYVNISDELLYSVAREFLPLTKLHLECCNDFSYDGIFCLLSKCQRIQYLDFQYNNFLNDQHVVQLSSFLGDLVSINLSHCVKITHSALFALTRNCPSLSEIKMEKIGSDIVGNSNSLGEFGGVYPQLKSLYLGNNSWLSDESIKIFASIFPNLQLLDLNHCHCISEGICQVLKRCCKIRHLNLSHCSKLKLFGMNCKVPKLEVLELSNTQVDDETLDIISKSCFELLRLSLKNCNGVTEKGVKHMVENCTQLRKILVQGIHISEINKELFKRHRYNVLQYSENLKCAIMKFELNEWTLLI